MTPYELRDTTPDLGSLVVLEGDEPTLGDLAIRTIVDRLLAGSERDLNLDRIDLTEPTALAVLESAVCALPFLAPTRIVIARNANTLLSAARTALSTRLRSLPAGNLVILDDIVVEKKPGKKPAPLALPHALTITTATSHAVRRRYFADWAAENAIILDPALITHLTKTTDPLRVVEAALTKAALDDGPLTVARYQAHTLATADVKGYLFAAALMAGRTAEALHMAVSYFADDPRASAIPLISGVATECSYLCEVARPNGALPAAARWREREITPIARRIGPQRARACLDTAVAAFAAIVSGAASDTRATVEDLSLTCTAILARPSA